jgi:pyrroloquinoline quinone biosynthesis protein E
MMNIELTTDCPFRCPQCYCTLDGSRNVDLNAAVRLIKEAGAMGVRNVCLSGGETLCYPHIYEVVNAGFKYCGTVYVALSGYGFTGDVFDRLYRAGVGGVFVSLNGSTDFINSRTRNGYAMAVAALDLLRGKGWRETYINWVMYSHNADDFFNVMDLAEQYSVTCVIIMAAKPDSRHELNNIPSAAQLRDMARRVALYTGKVQIQAESCFSPLLALINGHKGSEYDGCGAGRFSFSVNVDGLLSPCRHLDYFENWPTLAEYWEKSDILDKLRLAPLNRREPCKNCYLNKFCRHCIAQNSKLRNDIFIGNEYCGLSAGPYNKR